MVFWITCGLIALVVSYFVTAPMLRRIDAEAEVPDVAVYKAQLDEVDRDLARGVLAENEAEISRTEIARRLLAASRQRTSVQTAPAGLSKTAAVVAGISVIGVTAVTYSLIGAFGEPDLPLAERHETARLMRENRPTQAELAAIAPPPPDIDAPDTYLESIAQLRTIMPTRPDEIEGWELLAFHETELREYANAAVAQQNIIRLKNGGTVLDLQRLVDLMVAAADGFVSPEAEAVVKEILRRDETSIAGRYYMGLLYNLTDRADIAFGYWRPLVEGGQDTFHVALARAQIENASIRAGIDYTLPEYIGPDAEQIAASEDMAPEDRQAMIQSMVSGLATRLANEGGPASDWARLIAAYGVLGDVQSAKTVWTEAAAVFGADPTSMTLLRDAAQTAGVIE